MMIKFCVERPDYTAIVIILPNKLDGKYSFINLTKGHICSCKFDSIEDAILDMNDKILTGKIIKYTRI